MSGFFLILKGRYLKEYSLRIFLIIGGIFIFMIAGVYVFLQYFFSPFEAGSDYDPRTVFELALHEPIPASVHNVQGDALTWQDYTAYLRFNASEEDIDLIIQEGFEKVEFDTIMLNFLRKDVPKDKFSSSWEPDKVEGKECYKFEQNNPLIIKYIIVDRANEEVYFVGFGD